MLYIAILFIIVLIYINKKNTVKEKMQNKKGLLLLYGESFREANQGERLRDTENSIEPQKKSSTQHINLCNKIKEKYHYDMDILINTYDTKYENELKSWYKNFNLKYITNTKLIGPDNLVKKALKTIDPSDYDFIIFTRMDLCFKPFFIETFSINEKIMFVSIHNKYNTNPNEKCGFVFNNENMPVTENTPIVNPMIIIVPKTHYLVLKDMSVNHDAWWRFNQAGIKHEDMDFILDTYHDADSFKEYNPAYYLTSREEKPFITELKLDKGLIGTNQKIVC